MLDPASGDGSILRLLGEQVSVLQGRRTDAAQSGGRDIDIAVRGLDPLWPLRLPADWRLCAAIQYDVPSWFWILERQGSVVALDTLEDPYGLGRLGFSSSIAVNGTEPLAPPGVRAAYLTAKRLRKNARQSAEWQHITRLAREDPRTYPSALRPVLGRRLADRVARSVLGGSYPNPSLWRRSRRRQQLRRFRSPPRAAALASQKLGRLVRRAQMPTGLVVLVAGPDGAGKTTLTTDLPKVCPSLFRRHLRQHTRPKILPRPGALLGRESRDWSKPHDFPPHGQFVSFGLVLYYWLDFLVGGWTRLWPARVRTSLVLVERGWWDLAVDPRRYRLQVPASIIRALGSLLPRPDLALILEAPVGVMRDRKPELDEDEILRQSLAWQRALPKRVRQVRMDTSRPREEVVHAARREIVWALEERAISRLGRGWVGAPRPGRGERTTASASGPPRLILSRGPRQAAVSSLLMYQPCTFRGRVAWEAARVLANYGGLRLFPRGSAPPRELREALAPHLPPRSTYAVAESNHAGRFVAAVIDERGNPHTVAKVALEREGSQALEREGEALLSFGRFLPAPLTVPRIILREEGLLLFQPVAWQPRRRPWMLPVEVATALATFHTAGDRFGHPGLTHGDFAPWNLLRTDREWVLTDWEEAAENGQPFFDLFHYLVQAHLNLRRPSRQAFLEGLNGKGQIGSAIAAYSAELGVGKDAARPALVSYLGASASSLDTATPAGRIQLAGRRELLEALGG